MVWRVDSRVHHLASDDRPHRRPHILCPSICLVFGGFGPETRGLPVVSKSPDGADLRLATAFPGRYVEWKHPSHSSDSSINRNGVMWDL